MAWSMDRRGGIIPSRLADSHIHLVELSSRLQIQAHSSGVPIYSGPETEHILTGHGCGGLLFTLWTLFVLLQIVLDAEHAGTSL
jgi:hypothetical protein